MADTADCEIIEHHVEEEMEKEGARSRAAPSRPGSVAPSDREGGTQSSHRLLAYSDALISIIATVMVRHTQPIGGPVTSPVSTEFRVS